MTGKTVYITGATASYFMMTLPLLESFARFAPCHERIYVCDFGLTDGQRRFLEGEGQLLSRPGSLAPRLHPYVYKASMGKFAEPLGFDNLVWIDCDCLVVGPLTQAVDRICQEEHGDGEDFMAICQDLGGTIAQMLVSLPLQPFQEWLDGSDISRDNPYLNCAVFVLRSKYILGEWTRRVLDIPVHPLFEQNVLNYLAYKHFGQIHLLDREIWNVHDLDLHRLRVDQPTYGGDFSVKLAEKAVWVVHATSFMGRAVDIKRLSFPLAGGHSIEGFFRMVHNTEVKELFLQMLSWYLVRKKALLIETGAGSDS